MNLDEFRQPLRRRSLIARLWAKRPSAVLGAYLVMTAAIAAAGIWAMRTPYPLAGEPVVIAAIPPAEEITTASTTVLERGGADVPQDAGADEGLSEAEEPQFAALEDETAAEGASERPGERQGKRKRAVVIEPVGQEVYRQEAGIVVSPRRPLTPAPVKALIENAEIGPLPAVSGGKKSSSTYARPVSLQVVHSDSPKIALVIGGLGLNTKLTKRAIDELPADVTLAFAPYGEKLQEQVNAARKVGHEVLLQVPLEPIGFPAANPGPRTLLSDAGTGENMEALHWHMSRFSGYVGLVNYMGGRFLSNAEVVTPFMKELRKRGLLFLEDGSLPLTATDSVSRATQSDARKANIVIDNDPNPKSIEAALQLLEQEAQQNGFAIGTGSGLEITIDTVADWAKQAADRGIILVPVTAAFKGRLG
jgi:uncharacterized protein